MHKNCAHKYLQVKMRIIKFEDDWNRLRYFETVATLNSCINYNLQLYSTDIKIVIPVLAFKNIVVKCNDINTTKSISIPV